MALGGARSVRCARVLALGGVRSRRRCGEPATADCPASPTPTVVRVVDGDTIVVDTDGVEETRPSDRHRHPGERQARNRPVECFGKEASAHAEELLPEGTAVLLERDVEARDRYDRLLAYVYRASDGLFVNLAMVADGYAQPVHLPAQRRPHRGVRRRRAAGSRRGSRPVGRL